MLAIVDLCVSGSNIMVGIAHARRHRFNENGSHMLQLIVIDASVGPIKDTT